MIHASKAQARRGTVVVATLLSLVFCGCRDRVAMQVAAMNDTNLKKVSSLYRFYQYRNGWKGPKDAATLKGFTEQAPQKNLDLMQIEAARFDELLVSERDGQPAKVRWGLTVGPTDVQPLVFETEGIAGKRIVVFSDAQTEEVDAARYDTLWAEGGRPATAVAAPELARPGS